VSEFREEKMFNMGLEVEDVDSFDWEWVQRYL
jgi:hypothetical protein